MRERLAGVCGSDGKRSPCKCKDLSSVPQHLHKIADMWFIIPVLGRWREEDPWNSLASKSNLIGELQDDERDPSSKRQAVFLQCCISDLHM